MSEGIGVKLAAALVALASPGTPQSYIPKTYDRRSMPDIMTNMLAQAPWQSGAWTPKASGCVGVSQTFTSTGTFTANCTGTLTFQQNAYGSSHVAGIEAGGGSGAFASSTLAVTTGQKWLMIEPPGGTATSNNYKALSCPTAVAACTTSLVICSGVGLNSTNFVCAAPGYKRIGGAATDSFGGTVTSGANGGTAGAGYTGGGGAGAPGPGGAGANGTAGNVIAGQGGTGGTGDNGSGGAGGAGAAASVNAGDGTSNANGGGGGGGAVFGTPGQGGDPGGGAGANAVGPQKRSGNSQGIVHSMLDPATEDAVRGYSPGSVGTVSMS